MKNLFLLGIFFLSSLHAKDQNTLHYFSTVADEKHYPLLVNLIGSIHKNDYDCFDEIAIFDIGLTKDQRHTLNQMAKVKVFDVEKRHPDLLTPFQTRIMAKWFAAGMRGSLF